MVRIRNAINRFQQVGGAPFWSYLEMFKDLLAQCPHTPLKNDDCVKLSTRG